MNKDVIALMDALEIPYRRSAEGLHLTLDTSFGQKPVTMHIVGDRITLYARLTKLNDAQDAAAESNRRNRTLGDGCLVAAEDGTIYLKLTAYLMDELYAQESLKRALGRFRTLLEQNRYFS